MSNQLYPQSRFERKKLVWRRVFDRYNHVHHEMDSEILELFLRFLVSAGIIAAIFTGEMPGTWGGGFVTVIMGIDIAAAIEAFRESQTNNSRQATWEDE